MKSWFSSERLIGPALLLGSAALCAIVSEVALRILVPQIGWRQFHDVDLGWANREYLEFDPRSDKDDTRTRMLFLGDSYLAGSGVSSLDARFPSVLESETRAVASRVLATGGWGTDQQYLAMLQKGLAWQPDLVIIGFCSNNDISDIKSNTKGERSLLDRQGRRREGVGKPYLVLERGDLRLFNPLGKPLDNYWPAARASAAPRQSYLQDLIRQILAPAADPEINFGRSARLTEGAVDPRYRIYKKSAAWRLYSLAPDLAWSPQLEISPVSAFIAEDFEYNTYQWALLETILDALKQDAEKAGADVLLMVLPTTLTAGENKLEFVVGSPLEHVFETPDGSFTFRSSEPARRLAASGERIGMPVFDPTTDFLQVVHGEGLGDAVWPKPRDAHFSDVGHRILAGLLEVYLRQAGHLRE